MVQHILLELQSLRYGICVGCWNSFLDSEKVVQVMVWLDVLMDAVFNGFVDVMMPQFHFISFHAFKLLRIFVLNLYLFIRSHLVKLAVGNVVSVLRCQLGSFSNCQC